VHADVVRIELAAPLGPRDQLAAEAGRQQRRELLDARLQIVDDDDRLAFLRAGFLRTCARKRERASSGRRRG
jgi:hypothetical protein